MVSRNFLLRVLNVYPNEGKVVKQLYLFQFFQGAGIAFFFTSSFAQFLEKFPITELPWVMISSAFLLWFAGLLYTSLEHKFSLKNFNYIVIVLMALSILLLWIFNNQISQDWFLYLMLAWFNVLYLLNNLQFWGIAALIFDLRQSKRLFAVISSGDIPAKFIGYSLAVVLVPYTGTKNLLLMGAACMFASLPFFKRVITSGKLETNVHADGKHATKHPQQFTLLIKNLADNTYIRRIAFISLLTSTCVILLNYGFYGEVKKAYHDDVDLAGFIAFFSAGLRIVAFITKMVFSSRLTASVGIKQALFIAPLGMILFMGIIVSASWLTPDQKVIFYLFGVSFMLVDVLRTSFNSPVLLTLMQPLPTHERLRAHSIVKGIMDPFASLLSGIFLLSLFYMHSRVDLTFLSYVLLILGGLWILGVILVNRQYLKILIRTIGNRYFSREEFDLNDAAIIQRLTDKMMTGTDAETISILRMLSSKIDNIAEHLIARLLQHNSDQIKLETLRLIGSRNITSTRDDIAAMLQGELSDEVRNQAVRIFCKIGQSDHDFISWLDHSQKQIRTAAITGMLANADPIVRKKGEDEVNSLLLSNSREDKLAAVSILAELKDEYDHPGHAQLINDENPHVRTLAMKAVGKACLPDTVLALCRHILQHEKQVINSLFEAGSMAVPQIGQLITNHKAHDSLRRKLIMLCGKIGGENAQNLLIELLKTRDHDTTFIIKALYRCRYTADEHTMKLFENIARKHIVYGVEMLHMQQDLSKKEAYADVLNNSLQLELQEIREVLLCVFGCMYDREKINQVKYGLDARHRESIANAMEIVELLVKKDMGRQFNTMFEKSSIEQRCASLRSLFTEKHFGKIENILGRILSEKPIQYYNWTKAYSLYISKKYVHHLDKNLIKKYIHSDNKLLKETALFASSTS
jgi:HEAT repeat protein/ATP/ADP translocase